MFEKLIEAIRAKNIEEAQKLIAKMDILELSKVDNDGVTALTLAAWQGKRVEKICELLIPKMSDKAINYQVNNSGYTAFIYAANSGLGNICELLIPKMNKQAFNHVDKDGNTPLMCAANNYLDKVCEMLIPKMNAQGINYINNEGNTALTIAADRELEKTCELLINKMSNEAINQVTKDGNTVLTVAASKGLDKVCEALIPKMSEQAINAVVKDGFFKGHTALSIAKRYGFKNICDLLETNQKQIFLENNKLAETVNKFFHDPTSVSLCYQIITDDFAKLVADKLKTIKTITAIDFMGSTISEQSIKIITEALKASTQIKKLDFSGCELGNQKISVLAEILQLKNLTHLCLNANYIGTVGINAIIEALKENTTIMRIDLEQNNIDQQSQIIIEKYLQRNKNLLEEHSNFQKLVDKLNDKIANDANIKDKSIIEDTIKYIIQKTPLLIRTIDRDQIITDIQKLLDNKFTASKFMGVKEELEELIEQQSINDDTNVLGADSMFG